MKKTALIIIGLIFCLISQNVFAEDDSELDYYGDLGVQQAVPQQKYQEALDQVKSLKQNPGRMPKSEKKKKPTKEEKMFKEIKDKDVSKNLNILSKPYMLLTLPYDIYNDKEIVPKGYYNAVYTQENNKDYLLLKQGHRVIAKLNMYKTVEEPDTDTLYYAEVKQIDNDYVKVIYGEIEKHFENLFYIAR